MSLLSGFKSLVKNVNKVDISVDENSEGTISELTPELTLQMKDDELIALKKSWVSTWEGYEKTISPKQKDNEEYWLGKQFGDSDEKRPLVDNLIFESLETFLPIATRPKADPLVESQDETNETGVADKVRKMLSYTSDRLSYNLKIKQVARYWSLYHIGIMKVGWSMKENDITCQAIRPQKIILDPDATIEECEYTGYYIGEYVKDVASDLILRFPKQAKFIEEKVDGKMGTSIQYIIWTTDDYMFWTLDDTVLDKVKNPHWNYATQQPLPADPMTGQPAIDTTTGQPMTQEVAGNNHFNKRKKPYVFLTIFNLGQHPHDDTNLIQQNLPLQDLVNKRLSQIDKNADNSNGGIAVSGDSFTEEQARKIASTRRKGGTLWIPTGDVNNAVKDMPAQPLPNFVYESLVDYRNELRNIFGTRGSSAQGTIAEKTVGGKQIIKGQDGDRIGGGISTYLEEFSDSVYNWFVQLMYVYYDEPHVAVVLGKEKAKEYITLVNTDLTTKLLVGVKEGSMIPHDPQSKRDEALTLWAEKGIDPITFFDRLEFPNPRESAKQLFLWLSDPIQLFPDLLQQQQQQVAIQQQQAQQQQAQQQLSIEQQAQQQQVASEHGKQQDHQNKIEQIQTKQQGDYQNLMMKQ